MTIERNRQLCGAGPNGRHPDEMPADERLDEIARILALGLVRLAARQSSAKSTCGAETSLDFAGSRSAAADVSGTQV